VEEVEGIGDPLPSPDPDYSDDDVRHAILSSGYLLEQRVELACSVRGFSVHASRRIADTLTGLPRELDLTAWQTETFPPTDGSKRPANGTRLLIECVNNRMPLVFFPKPCEYSALMRHPLLFGAPLLIPTASSSSTFVRLEDEASISWQHQLPSFATQYCGFERQKDKGKGRANARLVATQSLDMHGTMEKLVAAAEEAADRAMDPRHIEVGMGNGWLTLIRPVLVLQRELLVAHQVDDDVKLERADRVHYMRRARIGDRERAWIIDVLTESSLPKYFDWIEHVHSRVQEYCLSNADRVSGAYRDSHIRQQSFMARWAEHPG
jgi:hypothetical protein